MTDHIKREDARGKLCSMCRWEGTVNCGECENPIDDIPAADVRPVVLCKDCKSCNTDIAVGGWYGMCAFWNGHSVMADDFCSRGIRKSGADMREVQDG